MGSLAAFLIVSCTAGPPLVRYTTWSEPWHEAVVLQADAFVRARVLASDEESPFVLRLEKHLAGADVPPVFEVDGFSLLRILSYSGGIDPRLSVKPRDVVYLHLVWSERVRNWTTATPTAGIARVSGDEVDATYRHSAHRAEVAVDVYERTQAWMFDHLHLRPVDPVAVEHFQSEWLRQPPSNASDDPKSDEWHHFLLQHVALELFYYFGSSEAEPLLEPFLGHDHWQMQISAVRALSRIDTPSARERLFACISGEMDAFARVMAVEGLKRLYARELAPRLEAWLETGKDAEGGFGFSLMDPRIGTREPGSVKGAVRTLLEAWKR